MKTSYGLPKKREEVIAELQNAFVNQNLDDIEYENRLSEALAAKSMEELEVIVFDFPAEIKHTLFPKELVAQAPQPTHLLPAQGNETYRVFFGEDKRQVPQLGNQPLGFMAIFSSQKLDFRQSQLQGNQFKMHVECILGETVVDLRNEDLTGKHFDIWVGGGLGTIKILVPRGGVIKNEAQFIGGEFNLKDKRKSWLNRLTGNRAEEAPQMSFTLTLHGNYWLGNVEVVY